MSNERTLKVKLVGEDVSAGKTLKGVEGGLGSLGIVGTRAQGVITGVQSKLKMFGPVGKSASSGIDSITKSAAGMGPVVMGAAAAGVVGLGLLAKMTKDGLGLFKQYVGEAKQVQRISGASAEDSSRWAAVLRKLNIDVDTGAKSLVLLAKNIATHGDKLRADGIEIAKNKTGHTDLLGTVLNVADAYNKETDAAQKIKIATDAFGKSGANLIPLLAKGRDGLQEFYEEAEKHHLIFSQKDFDDAKAMALASKNLKESWQGLEIQLGRRVVPVVTAVTTAVTKGVEAVDKSAQKGGILNRVWTDTTNVLEKGNDVLTKAINLFGGTTAKQRAAAEAADVHAQAIKHQNSALEQSKEHLEALTLAQMDLAGADPLGGFGTKFAAEADSLIAVSASLGDKITAELVEHIDGDKAKADFLKKFEGLRQSIAASLDVGDAWSKLEQDGKASLAGLGAALEKQIKDLEAWHDNLVAVAARGGADGGAAFAHELEAQGPAFAGAVAQLRGASQPEFDRIKNDFTAVGRLSGSGYAAALDTSLDIAPSIAAANGKKTVYELASSLSKELGIKKPELVALIEALANELHLKVAADITATTHVTQGSKINAPAKGKPAPGKAAPMSKTYDSGGVLSPGMTLAVNKTGHDEWVIDPTDLDSTPPVPVGPGGRRGSGGSAQAIEIPIHINGREIARVLIDDIHSELLKKQRRNSSLRFK